MKITELRIGSLLQFLSGNILEVKSEHFQSVLQTELNNTIKPIPLTEEWLLKFGFVNMGTDDFHHKDKYKLNDMVFCDGSFVFYPTSYYGESANVGECKFVHQLQNLYFALSGEELQLNQSEPTKTKMIVISGGEIIHEFEGLIPAKEGMDFCFKVQGISYRCPVINVSSEIKADTRIITVILDQI